MLLKFPEGEDVDYSSDYKDHSDEYEILWVCCDGWNFWYHSLCVLTKWPMNIPSNYKKKDWLCCRSWLTFNSIVFIPAQTYRETFKEVFLKNFFRWKKSEYHPFFCYYYSLTKYQQVTYPHWLSLITF